MCVRVRTCGFIRQLSVRLFCAGRHSLLVRALGVQGSTKPRLCPGEGRTLCRRQTGASQHPVSAGMGRATKERKVDQGNGMEEEDSLSPSYPNKPQVLMLKAGARRGK